MPNETIITFIATPILKRPYGPAEWSGEDLKTYEVEYDPPRNQLYKSSSPNFGSLLLEAVCDLSLHNSGKNPVRVITRGSFSAEHTVQTMRVFDLYAKANGVQVHFIWL